MSQEIKVENDIIVLVNKKTCHTCKGTGRIYRDTKYERKCYICDGVGETTLNSVAIGKLKPNDNSNNNKMS